MFPHFFKLRYPLPLSYPILPYRLYSTPIQSYTPSSTLDTLHFHPHYPLISILPFPYPPLSSLPSHPPTHMTSPSSFHTSGAQWKLIDLDASCVIGIDAVGFKSSSSYVPPEVRTYCIFESCTAQYLTSPLCIAFHVKLS